MQSPDPEWVLWNGSSWTTVMALTFQKALTIHILRSWAPQDWQYFHSSPGGRAGRGGAEPQTVCSEPTARLVAPAAAPLFSREALVISLQVKKTKALVKRGRKELQPPSRCALLSATGIKVAHACARWYVSSGIAAPVCLGRHFCRIPVLCPWGRLQDTFHRSW